MKNVIWAVCAVFGLASAGVAQEYGSGEACGEVPLACASAISEAYIAENMAAQDMVLGRAGAHVGQSRGQHAGIGRDRPHG